MPHAEATSSGPMRNPDMAYNLLEALTTFIREIQPVADPGLSEGGSF